MKSTPPGAAVAAGLRITPLRLAQPAHAEAFLMLLDHYARDPMGGAKPLDDTVRATLVGHLRQRRDFVAFLAFSGDIACGLINCFEGFSTFAARPLLNVHDLVVHADYRGQAIGRALLTAAEQAAHARGCCKLTLEVLSNNHAALSAYERAGFRPYVLDPAAGQALFLQKWL